MAVPVHHRDRVAVTDAEGGQRIGEPADARAKLRIAVAAQVAVHDLLLARVRHRRVEQLLDQERVGIRVAGALDQCAGRHD
jgi:hypothetical protein